MYTTVCMLHTHTLTHSHTPLTHSTHTHTLTHSHTHTHTHTHTCTHTHTLTLTHLHTHTRSHSHTYTHTHSHTQGMAQRVQAKNLPSLTKAVTERPEGTPLITVSNHTSCIDDPVYWCKHVATVCSQSLIR